MPFFKNHLSKYDKSEVMFPGLSKDPYRQIKSVCHLRKSIGYYALSRKQDRS